MRFQVLEPQFKPADAECYVVLVREGDGPDNRAELGALKKAGLDVAALCAALNFKGEADRVAVHSPLKDGLPKRVVLVGLGKPGAGGEEALRRAGAHAAKAVGDARDVVCALDSRDDARRAVEAFGSGFFLARYKFDRYLSSAKKEKKPEPRVRFAPFDAAAEEGARRGAAVADAVVDGTCFARDVGNLPGNLGTPLVLAREAQAMAKREGIRCRILDTEAIGRLKMGSFLSVSLGSVIPPRFVELEYGKKTKGAPTFAFVGKGLTFDSGGISIKPAADMDKMRHDKCGGAAVFGALLAIARLKLPVHVVGLVPCSENMPGKNANKPGDVVEAMNGKTIEILNTDAEGRLILADALCYAERFEPDYVVDLATLTGACAATFANHVTGLFGTDDELCNRLFEAGQETFERLWRLPIYEDYELMMKGSTTDLKNLGGARGGAITAAAFLKAFTGGRKWAHLDIAGTAWDDAQRPYHVGAGATGVGVRLLVRLLQNWIGEPAAPAPAPAKRGPARRAKR
jgi:leucyl aminopeptidase